MDFKTAARLGTYISKDYAEDVLRLLVNYTDISASEAASRLNLHIRTVQDFLEAMESLGIVKKEEVSEGKRPYFRYSLEEERARPTVLDARARAILAHSLAAFFCTATFVDATWTWHLGWVPLLVAWAHFDRARRRHPPGWFTFRSLRAFLLLDGALQLSYNSPFSALLGLLAFFWTGRRSRGPTPAGPAGASPPDAVPSEEEAS